MNEILEVINTVGFPVACCIALFYQNSKQDERYDKQMTELRQVIDNNTNILIELNTRLGGEKIGEDR